MTDASASLLPALHQGLEALGMALPDPAERQLLDYLALVVRWNRIHNLTAVREPSAMVSQHLLDSLAVCLPLRRQLGDIQAEGRAVQVLDVGSGAGLPGVVLAIAEPLWQVTCVDAVAKKAGFVRQVAAELGLARLRAEHVRVEQLRASPPGYDVITSRAFASLSDFTAWTGHLLAPDGVWMAMKGHRPDAEIAALPASVEVFHVEPLVVPGLDAARCLVWMRKRAP